LDIIIVGAGNVGTELVAKLTSEGHNIVVVETDKQLVDKITDRYDVRGIVGNGVSFDILEEAGVRNADLLIASTQYDEMNILCCLVAKKLGAEDTIARVRNPEYFTLFKSTELGLTMMVNPEYEVAAEITRLLKYPSAIKMEPFADGKVDVVEIKVPEGSVLEGLKLRDFSGTFNLKVLICAVERDGEIKIPTGDFELQRGDYIYVTASTDDLREFFTILNLTKSVKDVIIVGGSHVAYYLATELKKHGIAVKIIEVDENKCQKLDEQLTKCDIICGDGTDQDLLLDEGLLRAGALIVMTGSDEQNLIISMFASSKGVQKIITKLDKHSYYRMLASAGAMSVVSTHASAANEIVRYVRSKVNVHGGQMRKLYYIAETQAEVMEFSATATFRERGTPIKNLNLKKNLIIASIMRNGELIIPGGDDAIFTGDTVIAVTTEEFLGDLNDILR
jgi:K+ transport systems, NAD-binding component